MKTRTYINRKDISRLPIFFAKKVVEYYVNKISELDKIYFSRNTNRIPLVERKKKEMEKSKRLKA